MPYKKVEKGSFGRSADDALVSIRKSESVGLNEPVLDSYFSDGAGYVVLYHDEVNDKIAIKEADEDEEGAYKLSKSEAGATIGAMSFLKSEDLVPEVTTRYEPTEGTINGETEVIEIDLTNEHSTYGSPDNDEEE